MCCSMSSRLAPFKQMMCFIIQFNETSSHLVYNLNFTKDAYCVSIVVVLIFISSCCIVCVHIWKQISAQVRSCNSLLEGEVFTSFGLCLWLYRINIKVQGNPV